MCESSWSTEEFQASARSGVSEQVMGNLYVQQDLCGFSSVLRYGKRRHGSVGKK